MNPTDPRLVTLTNTARLNAAPCCPTSHGPESACYDRTDPTTWA